MHQFGRFLIQIDARNAGDIGLGGGGNIGRHLGRIGGALGQHANLPNHAGVAIAHRAAIECRLGAQVHHRRGIATVKRQVQLERWVLDALHAEAVVGHGRALQVQGPGIGRVTALDRLSGRVGIDGGSRVAAGVAGGRTKADGDRQVGGWIDIRSQRGELQAAQVAHAHRSHDRAGHGQGRGCGELCRHVAGGGAEGLEVKAVSGARRSAARRDIERQAVEAYRQCRGRTGNRRAIGDPGHGRARVVKLHQVIRGHELGVVGDGNLHGGAVGIERGRQNGVDVDRRKQVLSRIAVQIKPQALLRIHRRGDAGGQTPQQIAALDQVGVLELQRARQGASAQCILVQEHRRGIGILLDRKSRLIGIAKSVFSERHDGGLRTQHQGLAAAYEDAYGAVGGGHRGGLHIAVELADELIALVQQGIRRLTAALRRNDLRVDAGNLGGQGIDGLDLIGFGLADTGLQVVQALRGRGNLACGLADLG